VKSITDVKETMRSVRSFSRIPAMVGATTGVVGIASTSTPSRQASASPERARCITRIACT